MTILPELMYAILAMDAYNREYIPGIKIGDAPIGTATLLNREDFGIDDNAYQAWKDVDFYAATYKLGSGTDAETVISYRGTDYPDPFLVSPGASDIWNGWITGAGFLSSQARFAAAFYSSVAGDDLYNANISFTGHSLGGGLAGMAADL